MSRKLCAETDIYYFFSVYLTEVGIYENIALILDACHTLKVLKLFMF